MHNKKNKIDICIAFNDARPPTNIGMVPTNKPSYYEQTVCLIKSIKLNWNKDKLPYDIYVFHSRELDPHKKQFLLDLGCEVVHDNSETQPFLNKENVYKHHTSGDYTLSLDSDMLVLRTPNLPLDREIYMREEGPSPSLPEGLWKQYYKEMVINYEEKSPKHFNGGCLLIKNSIKYQFYNEFKSNLPILKKIEKTNRHFSIQYYYSLLAKKFDFCLLPKRLNYFSRHIKTIDDERCDIVHYLGIAGFNNVIKDLFDDIHKRYDEK